MKTKGFLRLLFGIIFAVLSAVYFILAFTYKKEILIAAFLFLIPAVLLLFIRKKKGVNDHSISPTTLTEGETGSSVLLRAREYERTSPNPKFHRSEAEKEKSFRFSEKYGTASTKICDTFLDLAHKAAEENDLDKKIELLQAAIDAFYKARDWHYAKSEGGKIYFQDMWEYMHNSQNPCFSWVDSPKRQIEEIIFERNILIPWIIEHAKTGFLQTELYKAFPQKDPSDLRKFISSLTDSGKISKIKKGNSYLIKSPTE